jgi:NAD-dependent dihydropyrimidine dehydrogenase PreA subunit
LKIVLPFPSHFDIVSLEMAEGGGLSMYVITDECTMCASCVDECAVDAISEGDDKYVIDQDVCVECGACADACPTGAIIEE